MNHKARPASVCITAAAFPQHTHNKTPKQQSTHPATPTTKRTHHVDTVLFHQRIDDGPARDERLLVGQRDIFFQFDGLNGRLETGGAHDSRHDRIGRVDRGRPQNALVAVHNFGHIRAAGRLEALPEFGGGLRGAQTGHLGLVL